MKVAVEEEDEKEEEEEELSGVMISQLENIWKEAVLA
jgi:hypothetical protein